MIPNAADDREASDLLVDVFPGVYVTDGQGGDLLRWLRMPEADLFREALEKHTLGEQMRAWGDLDLPENRLFLARGKENARQEVLHLHEALVEAMKEPVKRSDIPKE